jgi:hypothetical protein
LPLSLALVLATGSWSGASTAPLETIDQIEACVEANQPEGSSVQTIVVRSTNRVGSVTEMRSKIFWQEDEDEHSRVLMRFDDPPDMRGSALLLLEQDGRNDMFMYLPELRRVRRITSHMMQGSLFGTDFTYEDFERLQGMSENATSERLPDAEAAGRPAYAIRYTPAPDSESEYTHMISYVDKETCVATRLELYEAGERLRKVLEADPGSLTQESTGWVARSMTMRDLRDETNTEMAIEELEVGVELSPRTFSQRSLARGN